MLLQRTWVQVSAPTWWLTIIFSVVVEAAPYSDFRRHQEHTCFMYVHSGENAHKINPKKKTFLKENTSIRLMEMTKTIQKLRMKFNEEIETLKRTQIEMKLELKTPGAQLENSKESLKGRMDQA